MITIKLPKKNINYKSPKMTLKKKSRNLEGMVIGGRFPVQGILVFFHQNMLVKEHSKSSSKRTTEKILG